MSSDPPELGKGLFGYRKSAVNQIIADRDIMLRQAEGRVRAAESKVAELENELGSMRERNARMDEQIERLRLQLDSLSRGGVATAAEAPPAAPPEAAGTWEQEPAPAEAEAPGVAFTEEPAYPEEPRREEPVYEEPAYHAEAPTPAYGDEAVEPEGEWPEADQEWPVVEEPAPAAETEATPTAAASAEDDFSYGVEVQLGEDTVSESPEPAWMQTGPPAADQPEEHDEVAMAGGYGYGDFDSSAEEQAYGDYASEEEPEEAPSPFSRFPFTAEPIERAEPAPAAGTEDYQEEPIVQAPMVEGPAYVAERPPAEEVEPAAAASPEAPVSAQTADITNRFLTEELAGVLAAAEESAARIVERARSTSQRQIARSNRVWREVQAEVARFASWREEVEPIIRAVQSKVEGVRAEIEEVPERIRQALAPMADSISSIDGDLADLAAASNPPLLLTPSSLEAEDADQGSWEHGGGGEEGFEDDADLSEAADDEPFGGPSGDHFGRTYGQSGGEEGSGHLHAG